MSRTGVHVFAVVGLWLVLCQQEKDKAEEKTGGTWWDRRHKVMLSFASLKHDSNQSGFKTLHTCFIS